MGLIRMTTAAVGSFFGDQIKELFECGEMPNDVLLKPAELIVRGKARNKGTENVISNGSVFNVTRSQCAILVQNGKVHDFVIGTAETEGQYKYDDTLEPSLLDGGLRETVPSLKNMLTRFTMGGQSKNIMRLCYINMIEIKDNKIGLGNVPFRDSEFGFTVKVQGFGNYSFIVENPLIFFEKVCNDPGTVYKKEQLASMMKSELIAAMQPALGKIAASGVAYDQLINYPVQIADALNIELSEKWGELRGIHCVSLALESITVDEESSKKIAQFQESRAYGTNAAMAGGRLVSAQATAMETAAANEAGAFTGFMGMGMAMNQGVNSGGAQLIQNAQQQQQTQPATTENSWKCECGSVNTGKFCSECGKPRTEAPAGKFCTSCGAKLPMDAKFCGECGTKQ